MKTIFSIFFMVSLSGLALHGQAPEKRFVGNCSFSGFALLSDSTYRGDIVNFTDRFGDGYNLNQLAVGYEIFDGRGLVFEVDTIHAATNFTADVSVTAKVNRGFAPFGSGQAYNPTENGLIPPSSQEQAGLSPTQKARVDRHNVVIMQSLIGGRDSVYSISAVPDTSTLSPVLGDAFINATADTLGLYDGAGWVLFFGGSQSADGLTILGAGTGGDPFRVDTSMLVTITRLEDSLAAKQLLIDSLNNIVLYANMPTRLDLPSCTSAMPVVITGIVIDASISAGESLIGDITISGGGGLVVTYIQEENGFAYYEVTGSLDADTYAPEISYAGVTVAGFFNVVAGRPDTVTVLLPGDSILVTRVCGTEIARDTISPVPEDNITGAGTTNRIPVFAGVQNIVNGYFLQASDRITLDAGKMFVTPGGTTASRPTATFGGHWMNSTTQTGQWSDGTSWFDYSPWTRSGSNIYYSTGNVGVGGAPSYKLDVSGDVSVAPTFAYKYNGVTVLYANTTLGNYFVGPGGNLTMTGTGNFVFGGSAFISNTTGTNNVPLGNNALRFNTTGSSNVAVGNEAGRLATGGVQNQESSNSVYLGYDTRSFASVSSNEIVIGANNTGAGTNTVTLGNSSIVTTLLRGKTGIGVTPTAALHLPGGTAAASTAPLKFTLSGHTQKSSPEAGVLEPNTAGTRLLYADNTPTVNTLAYLSDITAVTTGLGTNDVPRWNGTTLVASGITDDGAGNTTVSGMLYPSAIHVTGLPDSIAFSVRDTSDTYNRVEIPNAGDSLIVFPETTGQPFGVAGSQQRIERSVIYSGDWGIYSGNRLFTIHVPINPGGSGYAMNIHTSNNAGGAGGSNSGGTRIDHDVTLGALTDSPHSALRIAGDFDNSAGGTSAYTGLLIDNNIIAGADKYTAIRAVSGPVEFSGTSYTKIHTGTTGQRPTGVQGRIRCNTDNDTFEGYDGTKWQALSTKAYTPSSTADTYGSEGDIAYDDDYIYIKTSAGWKRSALSTF